MKVLESIELYLQHCDLDRNLAPRTIEFYRSDLQQLYEFLQSEKIRDPRKIKRITMRSYYRSLRRWCIRSIRRNLTVAKGYLNFLEFEDIIKANPFRTLNIRTWEPRKIPTVMDFEEVKAILKFQASEKEKIQNKEGRLYGESLRNLLILEFLFATGVRVSELCGVKLSEIDLSKGSVIIHGKGNRDRVVHLTNPETKLLLHEYYFFYKSTIKSLDYFFINRRGRPISYSSVHYLVTNIAERAGIRKRVTPHTFRHTFATLFLEEEVDLKYIQHFLAIVLFVLHRFILM